MWIKKKKLYIICLCSRCVDCNWSVTHMNQNHCHVSEHHCAPNLLVSHQVHRVAERKGGWPSVTRQRHHDAKQQNTTSPASTLNCTQRLNALQYRSSLQFYFKLFEEGGFKMRSNCIIFRVYLNLTLSSHGSTLEKVSFTSSVSCSQPVWCLKLTQI